MASMKLKLLSAVLTGTLLFGASSALAEVVLHRGNGGEPTSLDPAHVSIDIEGFIIGDLFEGLVVFDNAGKIQPGVAKDWKVSDDGLTYTFNLRSDAKWSNGTPVTAGDFVFAWQREMNPKTAAEYANILFPIKNAEKVNKGELPVDQLGVKAVDDHTLQVTLEQPTPYFLQLMTHYTALPLNKANVEKFGDQFVKPGNLVSNGAFKLEDRVPNDHLTVVKNSDYWDAKDVKIDKVIFYPIDDKAAAMRRYEAGELDVSYDPPVSQLKDLQKKFGSEVHKVPALSTEYYAFDTREAPMTDVRVRRALSMAIDRDFIASDIRQGAVSPAYSFVPPGMEGYGTGPQPDFASLSQVDREDKAAALMKEAGYGKGGKPLNIEIRYNTNSDHEKLATAIADMWKTDFGANVKLTNLDVASHYSYLKDGGKFSVARAAWAADYADPQNFLFLLLGDNKTFNYSHWKNADYDKYMAESDKEKDPAKRMDLMKKAEAILVNEQPIMPIYYRSNIWMVSKKVKGWGDNAVDWHLSKYLSLDK
ncbi:peptide ABC transporter substrate-binding protein [Allorhizobium sp. BGMRC 0089]|uniref:peptide ABC transporter substrate-binding protein n=1 Tax=Allorhizobium sonneratiae TaxID=2934936 RepID=UPI002033C5EC|nr:peptide ABC transporter substrate-binding protein [Allorhizobium sonneratiae]MCM2291953.1 peptide ABC transporter substrate-binding protein [Allorhizobium sonneratiae]